MIINFKKILFLFAHPDDETLAAGGTINLLRRKKKMYMSEFHLRVCMQEKI